MDMIINRNEIVSATDFSKNFSEYSKKLKKQKRLFVFKNNQPDMVILDIDTYEEMLNLFEKAENQDILKIVEEREKADDGTIHTLDDALAIIQSRLSNSNESL